MARYRGPSGHKRVRRQRLAMETKGDVIVVRRKNDRPMPGNWRELLADALQATAEQRERDIVSRRGEQARPAPFVAPDVMIPKVRDAGRPWSMAFGVPRASTGTSSYRRMFTQRMAIDRAIEDLDTRVIPVIKQPKIVYRGGQMFLQTDIKDDLWYSEHGLSTFDVNKLAGIPGLYKRHIRAYMVRGGRLGLRTTCEFNSNCNCKDILPRVWERAWQM